MGDIALEDWKAWEHSYAFPKHVCTLIVAGLVQVLEGTKMVLEEDGELESEGRKILCLKFVGQTGTSWEPVLFQKKVRSGEYTDVELTSPHGSQKNRVKVKDLTK